MEFEYCHHDTSLYWRPSILTWKTPDNEYHIRELRVDTVEQALQYAIEEAQKIHPTEHLSTSMKHCGNLYRFTITVKDKTMNSYTEEITTLLEQHKPTIHERLAEGQTLEDVKEYAKKHILPLPLPDETSTEETYLMRQRKEDAAIIHLHEEKMLTIELLHQRAQLFIRAAEAIRKASPSAARLMATELVRNAAEDMGIDFFDTLSVYDYETYCNYDNLDKWAREAVFESAWENVFGTLESARVENGMNK